MNTRREVEKKAADILEKLATDFEELRAENERLRVENEKKDRQIKLASLKNEKSLDPKLAEQLSSMDKGSFDKVSDILGFFPGGDFGVPEKTASYNSSAYEDLRDQFSRELSS